MVAMVRRVAVVRATPIDPGYANATSTDQTAAAATPRAVGPPPDSSVRFSEPILADWTPKDQTPHTETVEVYTNAEEVELFLNGKSLGTEKLHPDASAIVFKVPFEPGTLKAVASSQGKVVATQELKTAGKPAHILFAADKPNTPLTPDWNDSRYVTATLVDADGTRIPDSTTVVHFAASGPASIIAVDNGNMMDHDPFQAVQRKTYYGNALALVRATGASGKVTVTASADGIPPASVTLSTAPIDKEDANIAMPSSIARSF
jgi:beta-galactosidase